MAAVTTYAVTAITPAQREGPNTGQQDDLDCTIPDTGIALGGDGATGYPCINVPGVYEGPNPLPVPTGSRPLPTGTGVGPSGQHYGFYAIVAYSSVGFTSPDTMLVDLSQPDMPLGTLAGISQASAAYDPASKRMIVLGNAVGGRGLWVSTRTCCLFGRSWWKTLGSPVYLAGRLNGNRESQIVALPGGGLLMVGAADNAPVVCAAASTAAGLVGAAAVTLVDHTAFPGGMYPYGPTVVSVAPSETGLHVTVRVSTFGVGRYDPHTYSMGFTLRS